MSSRPLLQRLTVALACVHLVLFVATGLAVVAHPPLLKAISLLPAATASVAISSLPVAHALVGLR